MFSNCAWKAKGRTLARLLGFKSPSSDIIIICVVLIVHWTPPMHGVMRVCHYYYYYCYCRYWHYNIQTLQQQIWRTIWVTLFEYILLFINNNKLQIVRRVFACDPPQPANVYDCCCRNYCRRRVCFRRL